MGDLIMKKPYYFRWILFTEAVGAVSGFLSREGSKIFNTSVAQPPLSPPGWVFPVVWGILYALMGIGAAKIAAQPAGAVRSSGLNLFIVQLTINFFWSLIFFNAQAYGFALFWLFLLIVVVIAMIAVFWKTDRLAALLQLPYLLWLLFAAYLNYGVWRLNG